MDTYAPKRLCCGQSHYGAVCPDGKVMCCLCFERVEQDMLSFADGQKMDVCQKCDDKEIKILEVMIATGDHPSNGRKFSKDRIKQLTEILAERMREKGKSL